MHADGFRLELLAAGYSASTVGPYVRLLAVLSGWLADNGLVPGDLTDEVAARFAATRRTPAPRAGGLGLRPLLAYLRAQGVTPAAVAVTSAHGEVLAAFTRYLTVERRLAPLTVTGTVGTIRRLLGTLPAGVVLAELTVEQAGAPNGRSHAPDGAAPCHSPRRRQGPTTQKVRRSTNLGTVVCVSVICERSAPAPHREWRRSRPARRPRHGRISRLAAGPAQLGCR